MLDSKLTLRLHFKKLLEDNWNKTSSNIFKTSIINKIIYLLNELKIKTIGIYYPLKYEINIFELIILQPNLKFFLPKIINKEMKYCEYDIEDELKLNIFGILEPVNNKLYVPELIIVPGLAFDLQNYRLGRGKGCFDQYIKAHKNLLTIGVCLQEQIVDNLPIEAHDQKLDFLVVG